MIIGIDAGISTIKVVGVADGQLTLTFRASVTDPILSLHEALLNFLQVNDLAVDDVEKVGVTGVGAGKIGDYMSGFPVVHVSEFVADAIGASYQQSCDRMVVVSMGTGTTFVKFDDGEILHMGGIGMGGGTLSGLARVMLGTDNIEHVISLASKGNIANANLLVNDVSAKPIPGLPASATASLFAKAQQSTSKEDIALALIWMVLETICSAAVLAAKSSGINDFYLIGNLSTLPQCAEIIDIFHQVYGVNIHVPEHSAFATAVGTAICAASIPSNPNLKP